MVAWGPIIAAGISAAGSIGGGMLGKGGSQSSSSSFGGTNFNYPFFNSIAQAYPGLLNYQTPTVSAPYSPWGVAGPQLSVTGVNYSGQGNNSPPPRGTAGSPAPFIPQDPYEGLPQGARDHYKAGGVPTGKSWDITKNRWVEVSGDPDLIFSGWDNNYYYNHGGKWVKTPPNIVNDMLTKGGPNGNFTNWFRDNYVAPTAPQYPTGMPGWMQTQITNNWATGKSWDAAANKWVEKSGNPDLVWDAGSDAYYYKFNNKWVPTPKNIVSDMLTKGGPEGTFTNWYANHTTPTTSPSSSPTIPDYSATASTQQAATEAEGTPSTSTGPSTPQAPRKWTMMDLSRAYGSGGTTTSRKLQDVERIWRMGGLDPSGSYTSEELTRAMYSAGDLSGTSKGIFSQALSYLDSQGQFLDSIGEGGGFASEGGGFDNSPRATDILDPYTPPDAPNEVLEAIGKGNTTGISWDPASRSWKPATGNPDIVWWSPTNTLYYHGYSVSPEQWNYLMANGPGATEEYKKRATDIWTPTDTSFLDYDKSPQADAQAITGPTFGDGKPLPAIRAPRVSPANAPGNIPFLKPTKTPKVGMAQLQDSNYGAPLQTAQSIDAPEGEELFNSLYSHNFNPAKQQLDFEKALEEGQTNASLSQRGLGTSGAAEGVLGKIRDRYARLSNTTALNASDTATTQYFNYSFQKASQEAQLAQQAEQGNQQAILATNQLNSERAKTNATLAAQVFITQAGLDMQSLTQDQQNALQVSTLNLQKALQNQQQQNQVNLANAGFDFQAQQTMLQAILTGNLAQLQSDTQVGVTNASLDLQAQQANMNQYANLIGLKSNMLVQIKNQMLQAMGLTQQDLQRMDNYTLQSLGLMLQDRFNFFSTLINASQISSGTATNSSVTPGQTSINIQPSSNT